MERERRTESDVMAIKFDDNLASSRRSVSQGVVRKTLSARKNPLLLFFRTVFRAEPQPTEHLKEDIWLGLFENWISLSTG